MATSVYLEEPKTFVNIAARGIIRHSENPNIFFCLPMMPVPRNQEVIEININPDECRYFQLPNIGLFCPRFLLGSQQNCDLNDGSCPFIHLP